MNPRLRLTALAIVSAATLSLAPASAATQNMKPGLWENTSKSTSQNAEIAKAMAQMQKQMKSMPPEQRKAMEKAMGNSGAPNFKLNDDGSVTVKMCITQKMIDDSAGNHLGQLNGNCTHKKGPLVGGTQSFSYTCVNPQASGEGKISYQADSYSSTVTMTSSAAGAMGNMTMESTGKYLGANCGDVKPVDTKPVPKPAAGK
ncbi:DUF3617 domain-containing protein [Massilia sp. CCM 9210]|uniref:DUF3617 domain-containing protein n=1 Tax=Massilia scottii TaxID=3057166 RepID=UPI0027964F96|nr:DUF3617 domain-containing protein [Massilia sp. CCM 9210]MDQ1813493.1 DUF3617 domain-containing protein [Massilia sp. CCM 9210]